MKVKKIASTKACTDKTRAYKARILSAARGRNVSDSESRMSEVLEVIPRTLTAKTSWLRQLRSQS